MSMNEPAADYSPTLNRHRLVHIVDHDLATCESLSLLFRLEGFPTAFSVNAGDFFLMLERRRPDIVVLNFDLPDGGGLDLLRRLKHLHLGIPVIMLEDMPAVGAAVEAMRIGATDVMTKPLDTEELLRRVREILRQDVHIGSVQNGTRRVEVRGFGTLTDREREVLQLIVNGRSNKEAGRELGISPRTVEVHRHRVMEKLSAKNTADLMRIVLLGR